MADNLAGYGFGLNRPPRTIEDRALGFPLSLLSTPPVQQPPASSDWIGGNAQGNPMEFMVLRQPHGTQQQSQGQMMNQQLPFGFMDPRQAEMMNWEQSRPAMGPIEAMAGMPDLYRDASRRAFGNSPGGQAMLDKWANPVFDPQPQQQSPMQPDMLQALMAEGNMLHALGNQDAQDAGTSFMQNARGGEGLAQYSGKLADQPWLDEFAAAGRAGVDLPMLQGNAGPQSDAMKAGIAERRQQRLGTPVSMNDRRNAVQQKAIAKSEQRASRMGDLSPNQQFFNEAGRFAGGMGEGGGDFLNGIFFGGQAMADMNKNRLVAEEAQKTRDWASSPEGIAASIAAAGGQPQPAADPVAAIVERSGGDWEKFKIMAAAAGIPANRQVQAWEQYTGQKKGGPAQPGFFGNLFNNAPSYQHQQGAPYPIPYG